jgi:hypothetical protein
MFSQRPKSRGLHPKGKKEKNNNDMNENIGTVSRWQPVEDGKVNGAIRGVNMIKVLHMDI